MSDPEYYLDMLAAAIAYNGMSTEDGFDAFDEDEDGIISPDELRVSLKRIASPLRSPSAVRLFLFSL